MQHLLIDWSARYDSDLCSGEPTEAGMSAQGLCRQEGSDTKLTTEQRQQPARHEADELREHTPRLAQRDAPDHLKPGAATPAPASERGEAREPDQLRTTEARTTTDTPWPPPTGTGAFSDHESHNSEPTDPPATRAQHSSGGASDRTQRGTDRQRARPERKGVLDTVSCRVTLAAGSGVTHDDKQGTVGVLCIARAPDPESDDFEKGPFGFQEAGLLVSVGKGRRAATREVRFTSISEWRVTERRDPPSVFPALPVRSGRIVVSFKNDDGAARSMFLDGQDLSPAHKALRNCGVAETW